MLQGTFWNCLVEPLHLTDVRLNADVPKIPQVVNHRAGLAPAPGSVSASGSCSYLPRDTVLACAQPGSQDLQAAIPRPGWSPTSLVLRVLGSAQWEWGAKTLLDVFLPQQESNGR